MVEVPLLDIYEAAYLAGGPDRVVDTAVVALVETGRVRVQSTGELCVVEDKPGHEIEAAVLHAIGARAVRQIELVRWRAGRDERLTALVERLRRDGLLAGTGLTRLLGLMLGRPVALTRTGRRRLRELRADPPARGVATGTSAARVALGGPAEMPVGELRSAVFHQPRRRPEPARHGRPGRSGAHGGSAPPHGGSAHRYWASCGGAADGHGGGCGGASGCGGGCGGGG
jgi:hypothetical protein